jgi:hypothetical protein
MNYRRIGFVLLTLLFACCGASAQSFSGDARKIGMGGIGYSENITAKMIDDERPYSSVIIPLGILQLVEDRNRFDPDNDNFDPILAMEYAANPLHFIVGRDPGGPRGRFVSDIVNGEFSTDRDLNNYRGFIPTDHLLSEGLANPNWGKTVKFRKRLDGSYQGFYVGVGPYISAKTILDIDNALIDILSSSTPITKPNQSFSITDRSFGQLALAITGGYRGRFALPGRAGDKKPTRDGIYAGMNYHYLKGFRYENPDMRIRFDTDSAGKVILQPTTAPVTIDYNHSHSGDGLALDFGIGAVVGSWEFGFAANGVGNRINWHDLDYKQFKMESLFEGGDFVDQRLTPVSPDLRVELPAEYIGNVGYSRENWSVVAELSHGFQGTSFHSGVEYRLNAIEFRGGVRYGLDRWHPSGGLGFNLGERFSIDVAAFGTTTNIERELKPGIALSFRFNRPQS